MSGAARAELWTLEGVAESPEWVEVRSLAATAYEFLPELSPADAVELLTGANKGFLPARNEHLDRWRGETAGHYNDVGVLATWLVDEVEAGRADCLPKALGALEDLLATRDPALRDLLVVGFLEDLQRRLSPSLFEDVLLPRTARAWEELVVMWHGEGREGWPGTNQPSGSPEFEGAAIRAELALPGGDRILLLDYRTGGPKTQENLIRVSKDGQVVWRADPPDASAGDSWVSVDDLGAGRIMANSWSGWRVRLDPATGRVVSRQSTK